MNRNTDVSQTRSAAQVPVSADRAATGLSASSAPASAGMATIASRYPWLWASLWALLPVVFVGGAIGYGQYSHLSDRQTYLLAAASVTVAAALGLLRMVRSQPALRSYGWRLPSRSAASRLWWFAPLAFGPLLIAATTGIGVDRSLIPGFLWLAAATAFSEEIWYRGLVMAALRHRSERTAIVGSAAIFGVLHLTNLAGGASPVYATLQVLFAALFGLVAALVVSRSGALWPVIAWHFAHDAVTYLGGDHLNTTTLTVLAVDCLVLAFYAVALWRRPRFGGLE